MPSPRTPRAAAAALLLLLGPTLAFGTEGLLVNLSARLRLPAGNAPMIAGFVVQGGAEQTLLIRATGPSLVPYGVSNFAPNPTVTVYDAASQVIASNTAWDATDGANIAMVGTNVGAFPLLPSSGGNADSAVVLTLPPGGYTVHVRDASGSGGVSVIEVYAANLNAARLVNISMRGGVGTGENLLAVGFVVYGGTREILARGVGPTLVPYGVTNAIAGPQITLRDDGNNEVAVNEDWNSWNSLVPVGTVAAAVGAFPLPDGSADAAMTLTLQPGLYTLQVTDRDGQNGESLLEIYEAPTVTGAYLLANMVDANWNAAGTTTSGAVRLTHLPMALADIESITPLGLMASGHVTPIDHIYFNPADWSLPAGAYDVFVVADGALTEISTRPNHAGTGVEYRVVLQHTATFYSYYDLIDVLDPAIAAQIPAGALDGGKVFHGSITVMGGQRLGGIGGKTLDFGNVDTATFLPGYIVPDHYAREPWKLFTVDTFAAYDEPLRSQLLAKNLRVEAPRGGKIDHDVAGALIGNWFRVGTNGYAGLENDPAGKPYWAGHLAVVPYVLDPAHIVVSLGDFAGEARQFGVKGNGPSPALVTAASGMIKYELIPAPNGPPPVPFYNDPQVFGTVLFQVLANNQLKVEIFPGVAAASVTGFTSAAEIYER